MNAAVEQCRLRPVLRNQRHLPSPISEKGNVSSHSSFELFGITDPDRTHQVAVKNRIHKECGFDDTMTQQNLTAFEQLFSVSFCTARE
jgi:hypothetical protein